MPAYSASLYPPVGFAVSVTTMELVPTAATRPVRVSGFVQPTFALALSLRISPTLTSAICASDGWSTRFACQSRAPRTSGSSSCRSIARRSNSAFDCGNISAVASNTTLDGGDPSENALAIATVVGPVLPRAYTSSGVDAPNDGDVEIKARPNSALTPTGEPRHVLAPVAPAVGMNTSPRFSTRPAVAPHVVAPAGSTVTGTVSALPDDAAITRASPTFTAVTVPVALMLTIVPSGVLKSTAALVTSLPYWSRAVARTRTESPTPRNANSGVATTDAAGPGSTVAVKRTGAMPVICAVTSAGRLATVPSVHCVCATPRASLSEEVGLVVPDPALTSHSTRAPDTLLPAASVTNTIKGAVSTVPLTPDCCAPLCARSALGATPGDDGSAPPPPQAASASRIAKREVDRTSRMADERRIG